MTKKHWTKDDARRAFVWVQNKSKTAAIFRNQSRLADYEISDIEHLVDTPELFADTLREMLLPDAWKRLLNALRQRKHKAAGGATGETKRGPSPDGKDDADKDDEIQRLRREMRVLYKEIDSLERENAALKRAAPVNGKPPEDIAKIIRGLVHPDKHNSSKAANRASAWINTNWR